MRKMVVIIAALAVLAVAVPAQAASPYLSSGEAVSDGRAYLKKKYYVPGLFMRAKYCTRLSAKTVRCAAVWDDEDSSTGQMCGSVLVKVVSHTAFRARLLDVDEC